MANSAKWLLVVVIWMLIVFAIAGVVSGVNHQWTPSGAQATDPTLNRDDQCEALNIPLGGHTAAIMEPQNTWSNAAYLLAGLLILFCSYRPMGKAVGLQLVVLALLSGYYHGTLQPDAQILDVASIYYALFALLFFGIQATFVRKPDDGWDWALALGVNLVLFLIGYGMAVNRTKVYLFSSTTVAFTLVSAITVVATWHMCRARFDWISTLKFWKLWSRDGAQWYDYLMVWRVLYVDSQASEAERLDWTVRSYFWMFAFVGGLSLTCRFMDGDGKPLCSPHAPIQAHAIWHIAGAITLLTTYDLFSWTSRWDFTVFSRPPFKARIVQEGTTNKFLSAYGPAIAALVLGSALFALSFLPGAFLDKPHPGDSPADAMRTGFAIAFVFIATGAALFALQGTGVVRKADDIR